MTNITGITGKMGSGKTTLLNKLKDLDILNEFEFLNMDEFRRNIPELKNMNIYNSEYKIILYKYLRVYLSSIYKPAIIEWALIIEDNLLDKFNKIIIVDCEENTLLSRFKDSDLTIDEIKKRLNSQLDTKEKIKRLNNIDYLVINNNYDIEKVMKYVKGG